MSVHSVYRIRQASNFNAPVFALSTYGAIAVAKDIFVEVEGKARETDFIAKPTATVHCDSLAFMNQACGRINPEVPISEGLLHWSGDETLGSHAARNLRFTM